MHGKRRCAVFKYCRSVCLAKTHRDEYMRLLHEQFPVYAWNKNMGYPTKEHREAIRKHGACEHHRMTFSLLPKQLKMEGFD